MPLSGSTPAEKRWYADALLSRITAQPRQKSWLRTPKSLTRRIRQHCPQMQVKVLKQEFALAYEDERQALGLQKNQRVWIREVLLQCDGQNWVFARTVIPYFESGNPWLMLQKLGTQPLGEILFDIKQICRSDFRFQQFPKQRLPLDASLRHARRSVFWHDTHSDFPLLLTEVFLHKMP